MKNLLLILGFIACTVAVTAQTSPIFYSPTVQLDTVTNSTAVTFSFDKQFYGVGSLEIYVQSDSLSGSTAGTVYFEYAYDPAATIWYAAGTSTINGVQSTHRHEDTNFTARHVRVRCTGGGTQSTKHTSVLTYKRNY